MNELLQGQLGKVVLGMLTPLLAAFVGCLPTGCAMFTPGASVRRGLEQSKLYEWRADGGFWVEGKGTQTEAFTMVQGDIKMKEGEDGKPVIDWDGSTVAYYLSADPNADVAGTAMGQAFAASTAQMGMLNQTIDTLLSIVGPLIPVPSAPIDNTETP